MATALVSKIGITNRRTVLPAIMAEIGVANGRAACAIRKGRACDPKQETHYQIQVHENLAAHVKTLLPCGLGKLEGHPDLARTVYLRG